MSDRQGTRPKTPRSQPTPAVVASTRPERSDSRGRVLRWTVWTLSLALVGLNAWWTWGDWSLGDMKAIDASIARGKLDEAEQALRTRLRWSPSDGDARTKLARILAQRGDQLDCARELHEVPSWWPSKSESSFLEAQAFKRVSHAREAEAAWLACIADDPLHPAPPNLFAGAAKELVALYVLEGRLDEARKTLWRAYDQATPIERPGVLAMRVRAELERIAHEEAVAKLRGYIEADPQDWDARRALALEEQAIGNGEAADRVLNDCLQSRPDDIKARQAQLEILQQRGNMDEARAVIDRLPSEADQDAKIWMYRGLVRQSERDDPGAFEAFRRSVELSPNEADTLYKLGMVEQRLGKTDQARDHIARSRELHQAYANLSGAYQAFLDQTRKEPRDEAGYRESIEKVASLCQTLGWQRVADAWRLELAPGRPGP
ncbi:tetratricopeptide repeat protein [Tundrisphaera lichenicola]|uniref:tetratricopeptide repeat protein n=1 Tax=Tundrisphaera lichenicola TaxID=2029860 RepID=UPI003EB711AF